MSENNLVGKVIMVTGASSGIGRELCLNLANAGCMIIAAARRTDRLESLCLQINGHPSSIDNSRVICDDLSFNFITVDRMLENYAGDGVRAVGVELDVAANGDVIDRSINKAWCAFGRIDALINNAGIRGKVKTPLNLTEEEWDETFNTNLKGLWLVSKSVCKRMHDAKIGGSVINVSSIADINRGLVPGGLAYYSSKAAVNTLTKMMALELGEYKIRVNSIAPGLFKSEITQGLVHKEWLKKVAEKTAPLGSYGTVDPALTSLVRYLLSDSSEYVTGNIFIADAGATLPGVPIFSSL